jgi:hypothetical protein
MTVIRIKRHATLGFVVPACTLAKGGSAVTFVNGTTGAVQVQFLNNKLFGVSGLRLPAPPRHRHTPPSKKLNVKAKAPVGIYPYSVFCFAGPKFAVGNSMPIIIKP